MVSFSTVDQSAHLPVILS